MATAEELIIKLRAVMDTSDIQSNVGKIQGVLNKLQLPQNLKGSFGQIFQGIEKEVNNINQTMSKGVKTKADYSQVEKSTQNLIKLYSELGVEMKKIDPSIIEKSLTFDTGPMAELTKTVQELSAALESKMPTESLTKIGQAISQLNTKSAAKKDLLSGIEEGNIDKINQSMGRLISNIGSFGGATDEARKKALELGQAVANGNYEDMKKGLNDLMKSMSEIGNTNAVDYITKLKESFSEGFKNIDSNGIQEINTNIQKTNQQIDEMTSKDLEQIASNFSGISSEIEGTTSKSKELGNSLLDVAKNQLSLNTQLTQLGSRVANFISLSNAVNLFKRALQQAFQTVQELDEAMTETAVVTDFSVGDMWDKLPQYTQIANQYGSTIKDAYEVMTIFYQQGLETNQVFEIGAQTMQMARIAGLDYADAADKMTNALRGFNMELNETSATRVNDVYSELAAISASDTNELATAMTKVASLANSANMEFENTAAFLAQMIETTRESAETAGTALKTVVARFAEVKGLYNEGQLVGDVDGEEINVNKVGEALRAAGINLNEFMTGAKGLDDILLELSSKWDSLDLLTQRYIATMAAGSRQQSRFLALMSDNSRLTELTSAAYNSQGASAKQFGKTQESLETKLNRLKNAWNEFLMNIESSEMLKGAIDGLTSIITLINKLTGSLPPAISLVTNLGLAFGGIKLAGTVLEKGLGALGGKLNSQAQTQTIAFTKILEQAGMAPKGSTQTLLEAGESQRVTLREAWNQRIKNATSDDIDTSTVKGRFQQFTNFKTDAQIAEKRRKEELKKEKEQIKKDQKAKSSGSTTKEVAKETAKEGTQSVAKEATEEVAENAAKQAAEGTKEVSENIKTNIADSISEGSKEGVNSATKSINNLSDQLDDCDIPDIFPDDMESSFDGVLGKERELSQEAQNWAQSMGTSNEEMIEIFGSMDKANDSIKNMGDGVVEAASNASEEIEQVFSSDGFVEGFVDNGVDVLVENADEAAETVGDLGNAGAKAGGEIASGAAKGAASLGSMAVTALAVAAAIAAIAAISYVVYQSLHDDENALEGMNNAAEDLAKSASNIASAVGTLQSSLDALTQSESDLDGLVEGTTEWYQKLVEVNEQAMQIIDLFDQYGETLSFTSENGQIKIDVESYNKGMENITQKMIDMQSRSSYVNAYTKYYNKRQENENELRAKSDAQYYKNKHKDAMFNNTITAGSIASFAAGGALLGTVVPGVGNIVGAIVGGAIGAAAGVGAGYLLNNSSTQSYYDTYKQTYDSVQNGTKTYDSLSEEDKQKYNEYQNMLTKNEAARMQAVTEAQSAIATKYGDDYSEAAYKFAANMNIDETGTDITNTELEKLKKNIAQDSSSVMYIGNTLQGDFETDDQETINWVEDNGYTIIGKKVYNGTEEIDLSSKADEILTNEAMRQYEEKQKATIEAATKAFGTRGSLAGDLLSGNYDTDLTKELDLGRLNTLTKDELEALGVSSYEEAIQKINDNLNKAKEAQLRQIKTGITNLLDYGTQSTNNEELVGTIGNLENIISGLNIEELREFTSQTQQLMDLGNDQSLLTYLENINKYSGNLSELDFSNSIEAAYSLKKMGADSGFPEFADQLQTLWTSGTMDGLSESIEDIVKENGFLTSDNIKDLAKESSTLNKFLELNEDNLHGITKAINLVNEGTLKWSDLTKNVVKSLNSARSISTMLAENHIWAENFDPGYSNTEAQEKFAENIEAMDEMAERKNWGNNQFTGYLDAVFDADKTDYNSNSDVKKYYKLAKAWENNDGEGFYNSILKKDKRLNFDSNNNWTDLKYLTTDQAIEKIKSAAEKQGYAITDTYASSVLSNILAKNRGLSNYVQDNNVREALKAMVEDKKPGELAYTNEEELESIADSLDLTLEELKTKIYDFNNSSSNKISIISDFVYTDFATGKEEELTDKEIYDLVTWNYTDRNSLTGEELYRNKFKLSDYDLRGAIDEKTGSINYDKLYELFDTKNISEGMQQKITNAFDEMGTKLTRDIYKYNTETGQREVVSTVSATSFSDLNEVYQQKLTEINNQDLADKITEGLSNLDITFNNESLQEFKTFVEDYKETPISVEPEIEPLSFQKSKEALEGLASMEIKPKVTPVLSTDGTTEYNPWQNVVPGYRPKKNGTKNASKLVSPGSDYNGYKNGLSIGNDKKEIALTGEEGPELIQRKNGGAYLTGTKGPEMVGLNKGDIVYNNRDTKKIFKSIGGLRGNNFNRYAIGKDAWKPRTVEQCIEETSSKFNGVYVDNKKLSESKLSDYANHTCCFDSETKNYPDAEYYLRIEDNPSGTGKRACIIPNPKKTNTYNYSWVTKDEDGKFTPINRTEGWAQTATFEGRQVEGDTIYLIATVPEQTGTNSVNTLEGATPGYVTDGTITFKKADEEGKPTGEEISNELVCYYDGKEVQNKYAPYELVTDEDGNSISDANDPNIFSVQLREGYAGYYIDENNKKKGVTQEAVDEEYFTKTKEEGVYEQTNEGTEKIKKLQTSEIKLVDTSGNLVTDYSNVADSEAAAKALGRGYYLTGNIKGTAHEVAPVSNDYKLNDSIYNGNTKTGSTSKSDKASEGSTALEEAERLNKYLDDAQGSIEGFGGMLDAIAGPFGGFGKAISGCTQGLVSLAKAANYAKTIQPSAKDFKTNLGDFNKELEKNPELAEFFDIIEVGGQKIPIGLSQKGIEQKTKIEKGDAKDPGIFEKFDTLSESGSTLFSSIKNTFDNVTAGITSFANTFWEVAETVADYICQAVDIVVQAWTNREDILYNFLNQVEKAIRDYEKLLEWQTQVEKGRVVSSQELVDNWNAQWASLEEQLEMQNFRLEQRQMQLERSRLNPFSFISGWNPTMDTLYENREVKMMWDLFIGFGQMMPLFGDLFGNLNDLYEDYDARVQEAYEDRIAAEEEIAKIEEEKLELVKEGSEEATEFEQKVLDAFLQKEQEQIDELTRINESISNANANLINTLKENYEKMKQDRENEKKEEDITEKERRLAYLKQDTSNANKSEIKKLEEELDKTNEDYTNDLINQKINELEQQNQDAADQRQKQIDLLQAQYDWSEKYGLYWDKIYGMLYVMDENGNLTLNLDNFTIEGGLKANGELSNLLTTFGDIIGESIWKRTLDTEELDYYAKYYNAFTEFNGYLGNWAREDVLYNPEQQDYVDPWDSSSHTFLGNLIHSISNSVSGYAMLSDPDLVQRGQDFMTDFRNFFHRLRGEEEEEKTRIQPEQVGWDDSNKWWATFDSKIKSLFNDKSGIVNVANNTSAYSQSGNSGMQFTFGDIILNGITGVTDGATELINAIVSAIGTLPRMLGF